MTFDSSPNKRENKLVIMPEGHSAMDKALDCHKGGQGINQDATKNF